MSKDQNDCTYLYFKSSGKWKYSGRGRFPFPSPEVDRSAIKRCNDGVMPGIMGDALDMVVIVVPDEDSAAAFAYPRMLKAVE